MEFPFQDQIPDRQRLPPEQVRIIVLQAEPYPDGQRVRVFMKLTPFQKRPHLEVTLTDPFGDEADMVNIIEPLSWQMEFTMHIRGGYNPGLYSINARLFYPEIDPEGLELPGSNVEGLDGDHRCLSFEIKASV